MFAALCISILVACHLDPCACSEAEESCGAEQLVSSAAHSNLMQVHYKKQGKEKATPSEDESHFHSIAFAEEEKDCSNVQIGKDAPITKNGYKSAAESCCFDDMKDFIRRVVADAGNQVCDEGGLSGFAPFYSCSSSHSLAELRDGLGKATAESGNPCAWLGKSNVACAPPSDSCSQTLRTIVTAATSDPASGQSSDRLLDGFVGLSAATNPSVLVTKSDVKGLVGIAIASRLLVNPSQVVVAMGSGPLADSSLLEFNKSDAASCTVFATYVVVQTTPPSLDSALIGRLAREMDTNQLEVDLAKAVSNVAPEAGSLKITKVKSCEEGGVCNEKKIRPDASRASQSTTVPTPTVPGQGFTPSRPTFAPWTFPPTTVPSR